LYEAVIAPVTVVGIFRLVIVNIPVTWPLGIFTLRGKARFGRVVLRPIFATPLSGIDRVTVHVAVAFEPSVDGVHCIDETTCLSVRLKFRLLELPL